MVDQDDKCPKCGSLEVEYWFVSEDGDEFIGDCNYCGWDFFCFEYYGTAPKPSSVIGRRLYDPQTDDFIKEVF